MFLRSKIKVVKNCRSEEYSVGCRAFKQNWISVEQLVIFVISIQSFQLNELSVLAMTDIHVKFGNLSKLGFNKL